MGWKCLVAALLVLAALLLLTLPAAAFLKALAQEAARPLGVGHVFLAVAALLGVLCYVFVALVLVAVACAACEGGEGR